MPKNVQNSQAVLREVVQYLQDEIEETQANDKMFKSPSYKNRITKDRLVKETAYNHGRSSALHDMLYHIKREFVIE